MVAHGEAWGGVRMGGVGRKNEERSKGTINILGFSSNIRSYFAKRFTKNSSRSIERVVLSGEARKNGEPCQTEP